MDKAVLNMLSENLSEFMVYAAIALIMLIGLIKCVYPVARNGHLLNRAIMRLEKDTANGDRPPWREQRFLGRSLRNEWQQFLLNAGQLDLRGISCDTRDYINEETVIEQPGHAQLADLIPSLLTSLGILGTFLGLMQGLTSVDFSNAEGTIQSIPQMLSGMQFAFATSVAGISCSLVFNMLNRIATGHTLRALGAFEDTFYELVMPRPLDPEVQLLCQKQDEDAAMAKIAEQIGSKIASGIESAVTKSLQPVVQLTDQSTRTVTAEQVEAVRMIALQFMQQMNGSFSAQIGSLTATFANAQKTQEQMMQSMMKTMAELNLLQDSVKQMNRMNTERIMQIQDMCTQLDTQQERRNEALQSFEDSIQQAAESLNRFVGSMEHPESGTETADDALSSAQK